MIRPFKLLSLEYDSPPPADVVNVSNAPEVNLPAARSSTGINKLGKSTTRLLPSHKDIIPLPKAVTLTGISKPLVVLSPIWSDTQREFKTKQIVRVPTHHQNNNAKHRIILDHISYLPSTSPSRCSEGRRNEAVVQRHAHSTRTNCKQLLNKIRKETHALQSHHCIASSLTEPSAIA